MKKVGKFIKSNIKLFIGIIVGPVIAGGSVAVVSAIAGSSVTYTDTNGIGATTVQEAIDKLYTLANQPKGKNNTIYFAFGEPTTSSTTDYTTLNKKVFVALNGGQKSVCIIRNSKLHCFDNNNWAIEKLLFDYSKNYRLVDINYIDKLIEIVVNEEELDDYIKSSKIVTPLESDGLLDDDRYQYTVAAYTLFTRRIAVYENSVNEMSEKLSQSNYGFYDIKNFLSKFKYYSNSFT